METGMLKIYCLFLGVDINDINRLQIFTTRLLLSENVIFDNKNHLIYHIIVY